MRLLYLGNGWLGWQVLRWLRQREEIVGLVIHPPSRQKYGREIQEEAALPAGQIFDGSRLRRPEVREAIRQLRPECGLSILFGYLLKPEFLEIFPRGVANLHPSLLPHNRGAFPNVWSIVDGTPAGVTLHHLDAGVDTGDIIAQREVAIEPVDTGESLYRKLEEASLELFQEIWPRFRAGKVTPRPQDPEAGSYHRTGDVKDIDQIDLDRSYTARDLINVLRARTFPPHRGAWFSDGGRRIQVRIELTYSDDEESP